jgi:F0F1-type ATP synthase assembly protein I
MALFVFGGYLIDRLLETEPAFLLAGTLLGAMMVIFDLVRRTRAGVGGGKKGVD